MMYEIREVLSSGVSVTNIVRIDDYGIETFIPVHESNSDYQQYLLWLEEQA